MTDQEIRIAIAEWAGVKPVLVEWWAHHPTENSICFSADTKREIEVWLESLPDESPFKCYAPKPFYRYPDYLNDLNAIRPVEEKLTDDEYLLFMFHLPGMQIGLTKDVRKRISADARQRTTALLKAIGKWKD